MFFFLQNTKHEAMVIDIKVHRKKKIILFFTYLQHVVVFGTVKIKINFCLKMFNYLFLQLYTAIIINN